MAKLDWRRRNEDAVRRLQGEDVPLEPEPLAKRPAFDFGERFDEPAHLLCATCGSRALTPVHVARRSDGVCAFFRCSSCGRHFGLEFVQDEGVVTVAIFEPTVVLPSVHHDEEA
jgi:hypothetical protein